MKLIMSFMTNQLKSWEVLLILLVLRIASVFLVQTWYVPDEYWQATEVAHRQVFGTGYLTWEWTTGIRNYIYPGLISALYKILSVLHLDYACLLVTLPRICQALLTVYSDYSFYQWANRSRWALFGIASTWFWFYIGSRTLINSFETAITTIALTKFPWLPHKTDDDPRQCRKFISLVGLVCAMRPTAAIIWLPLCGYHLLTSKESVIRSLIVHYLPIIFTTLVISTTIDSIMHGSLIFTWYEFLKVNFIHGVSDFYGSNPWHWYLSQGFPAIIGIQFIPFLFASYQILKNRDVFRNELIMLFTITFTIFVYSLLSHKEFRFISATIPMVIYISSTYLSNWSRKANISMIWIVSLVLFIGNVVPAYYLSLVHQRGTLDVMEPLRNIAEQNPRANFLFLMPCHSTPLYSHLHSNVTTRFLTCNPNLSGTDAYVCETDNFYANPGSWIRNNYPLDKPLPTHIVAFDNLVPYLSDILSRYKEIHRIFHTDIPLTSRIGNYVTVHERYL